MKNNILILLVIFEHLILYLFQDDYNVDVNMDIMYFFLDT